MIDDDFEVPLSTKIKNEYNKLIKKIYKISKSKRSKKNNII